MQFGAELKWLSAFAGALIAYPYDNNHTTLDAFLQCGAELK